MTSHRLDLRQTPGVRTLGSPGFRLALATMLAVFGIGLNVLFVSVLQDPDWRQDFLAYFLAAESLSTGGSPFSWLESTNSLTENCVDCYLYPPTLAQVLGPVLPLGLDALKAGWAVLQLGCMVLAMWWATGIGGARRSAERLLWCVVATTWFLPVFVALWYGNVSTLVALSATMVAMGGAVAGVGGAAGVLLKAVPATLLPAVVAMGHRPRSSLVLALAVGLAVAIVLAPDAWLAYPGAAVALVSFAPTTSVDNYSPAVVAAAAGLPQILSTAIRTTSIALGVAAVVASVWMARRSGGAPPAALAGTVAMLVLPGALWYHYLVVLLPFAAMAWPKAKADVRVLLLLAALLISAGGLGLPFLALAGASVLVLAVAVQLWVRAPSMAATPPRVGAY